MIIGNVILKAEEADIVRQWFDAVQDLNPGYLMPPDYELAQRIYNDLGMRVPLSIRANVEG